MDAPELIGDEIRHRGELVAIVVNDARGGTVMGEFLDFMADPIAYLDPEEEAKTPDEVGDAKVQSGYDDALADIEQTAKEYAKGGLLRLSDLAVIIKKLKEEE